MNKEIRWSDYFEEVTGGEIRLKGSRIAIDTIIEDPIVRQQLPLHEPTTQIVRIGDDNIPPHSTPDEDILDWIAETGYILVTHNRRSMPDHLYKHFADGKEMPGMFLVKRFVNNRQLVNEL